MTGAARAADQGLTVELFGGSALQAQTKLEVRQEGQPDLRFTARWETHPFTDSPYYSWRVGLWNGRSGWELQLTHHKAYLGNPTPEIEHFEISHGYNLVTFGHAWRLANGFVVRAGAGPVITHVEATIRGLYGTDSGTTFGGGYDLSGATVMLGVGRTLHIVGGLGASLGVNLSGSWVKVKIAEGTATVPNVALHGQVGLGYTF
ncbi:MAG: hypothetical protein ABIT01_04400 [Thermoanaerobaculia bacterium]